MGAVEPFLADYALKHGLSFFRLVLLLAPTEEAEVVLIVLVLGVGCVFLVVEQSLSCFRIQ